MVDKNLFLYDLSVVTIMKNEGNYVKEWLDYHLLAGVNHFYIFDNESSDNLKEILQPYIEKNLVTYTFFPGKARQYEAYNDATQNFKFESRYMAFIDADEFIFPKKNKNIVEVLDEILSDKPDATGIAVNIHNFGSNFQEKADFSRGLLERFTRRASDENIWANAEQNLISINMHVSSIVNPRKIDYFWNPHYAVFFDGLFPVNENGEKVKKFFNIPPTVEKIVMNHYPQKSREEYEKKVARGAADYVYNVYKKHPFEHIYNDEFDDEILKYRNERKKIFIPKENQNELQQRIFSALEKNLMSVSPKNVPENFFDDKIETFLTCLYVGEKFNFQFGDRPVAKYALFWIYQTMMHPCNVEDWFLIFSVMPKILKLPYSITEKIRITAINYIPKIIEYLRSYVTNDTKQYNWQKIVELKNLYEILKAFDFYEKKFLS